MNSCHAKCQKQLLIRSNIALSIHNTIKVAYDYNNNNKLIHTRRQHSHQVHYGVQYLVMDTSKPTTLQLLDGPLYSLDHIDAAFSQILVANSSW